MKIFHATTSASGSPAIPRLRGGFSFPEVLFAVMILGIGLIMVASMFPVGIKLSQQSAENMTVDAVGRGAVNSLQAGCNTLMTDVTDTVIFSTVQFAPVKGNQVYLSDPRFAWVPLYQWDGITNKNVFFFIAKSRRTDTYTADDLNYNNTLTRDLAPKSIAGVKFYDNAGITPDQIEFPAASGTSANRLLIGEGAYVVVSDYTVDPAANGQVYRVGQAVDAANGFWELLPGFDLQRTSITVKPTDIATPPTVMVLGKQLINVTADFDDTTNFELTAQIQDVGFYQATIAP